MRPPAPGPQAVDGVDLRGVSLSRARTLMSWIPQMPVMFAGTLRFNIDPFDQVAPAPPPPAPTPRPRYG